jgi:hypothetical protein
MAFRFEDGCRPNYNPAWPTVSNVKQHIHGHGHYKKTYPQGRIACAHWIKKFIDLNNDLKFNDL